MEKGERTHIAPKAIDYHRALRQHVEYCRMLAGLGVQVRTLNVNRYEPDSVFIEDTAVVFDEFAVLASMGVGSRQTEPQGIEPVLREYREVHRIETPATLEGGDVVQIGQTILVGLSSRTNQAGVEALENIVGRYDYRVIAVPVGRCLHLKTACTALPDNTLLVNPALLDLNALLGFEYVAIPEEEPWAADTLSIGSRVCVAAEHVRTAEMIRQRGIEVVTVDLSEFAKAEGGITCLSLLLNER
jgi:dimethylargininase